MAEWFKTSDGADVPLSCMGENRVYFSVSLSFFTVGIFRAGYRLQIRLRVDLQFAKKGTFDIFPHPSDPLPGTSHNNEAMLK